MNDAKFYVQLPADEHGNTGYPLAVIEAIPQPYGDPYSPGRERLIVSAPPEFAAKWPAILRDSLSWWAETEGPARMLTREEWAALIPEGVVDRRPAGQP